MPSNWLFVDTNFPTFTGEESTEDKISTMQNYMFMLVEQLRYSMHHLDSSNVRSIDMDKTKIYSGGIELMTMIESGEKMSVMQQRVDEIYAAVMDSGDLAEIVLGNDEAGKKGITATVADLEKGMASVVRLDKDGLWVIDEKGETVFLGGGDIILDGVLMSGDGHNWIQMQDVKLGNNIVAHVNHYYGGFEDGELPVTSFGYDKAGSGTPYWYMTTMGELMIAYDYGKGAFYPYGTWDFSNATLRDSGMKVTAVFA